MARAFLPADYRRSVTPEYLGYTWWQAVHNVFGSASGVLATQAMLYAMGLGAGALPLSAAINWVIKDGFGQLGGVLYATMVGQRFDSDPKHQRFWSAVWLQAATWLEMLAPLAPHLFLLIGSVANIGKNIAWLAMSATKASINRTFCLRENLGDLTAKSGSQATAAGLVGTALGVAIGATVDASVNTLLLGFVPLSAASLWGNYQSLLYTATPTLNVERAQHMLQDAIVVQAGRPCFDAARLRTPRQVSKIERFMRQACHVEPAGRLPGIAVSPSLRRTVSGPGWSGAPRGTEACALTMVHEAFSPCSGPSGERYYIGYLPRAASCAGPGRMYLWFDKRATSADMLLGFYQAIVFRELLGHGDGGRDAAGTAQALSYMFAKQTFDKLHSSVAANGWDTETVYLAKQSAMVDLQHRD
ncbi:hypothetical protein LPJ61_004675 [Coemansia biformis]|uniref:Protein root UVB sensitive/RUS domain-containing protein n=1 Tax=Coemansia biformis TaxID=1286918 RepID=A0A9W7Y4E9_9FUNG|nr:hypothetical protein LPJ61_004675 [Coemansia biformis]